ELNSLTVEDLRFIPAGAGNTPDKSFPVPVRFIPAGAGNTGTMNGSALMPAVYPRWRGEHGKATPFFIDLAGLSPLARGTRGGLK
ncbi:hypothetical protein SET4581_20470, partial [Salmonella enterica subsp. enterica serovar Typhimurium str. ST4581]